MAIVGLDLGYTYTKTNTGVIFPSKITQVEPIMGGNSIFLKDKTYYVGDGKGTLEINKIDEVITDVCLMYALSKCYDGSDFDIVTGLPISQYKTQKNQMKRMLLNHDKTYITVNDCVYPISIRNAEVYPQAAGALQSANILSDAIVIDIGGRTVDIAYFDYLSDKRKLVNSSTLFGGMLALYSRIIEAVNLKYDTTLPVEYAEKILTRGLMYKGEMQDISFFKTYYCRAHYGDLR